ncbi:MAG: hypothetical protein GX260_00840 [Tissierellia bacterium]|nr:hypothetical protein [Bacillota bacterium]NLL22314.1 hypothetical protein [Tissierellia bacterium]
MKNIHTLGERSLVGMLILMVGAPMVISVYYNIFPPAGAFLSGFLQAAMIYLPIAIAEYFTFVPILGPGGSYLAFVTGNLTNLKIPAAVVAMDQAGVKSGTEEGAVIAQISVAISSMVTIGVVFVGMLMVLPLQPLLSSPVLAPAFDNILPALFGALGAHFFSQHRKLAVVPLLSTVILAALVIYVLKLNFSSIQGVLIPILGVISVVSALYFYRIGWIKKEDIE